MTKTIANGKLIQRAAAARRKAYAPYSGFAVGAALLTEAGIYTGCNVENSSLGGTMCAERVALFKAISDGARQVLALAVVADSRKPCSPCGFCRQVLAEFGPQCRVIMANVDGQTKTTTLDQLLPDRFVLGEAKKP